MLLKCCLIHITIIKLKHILQLVYLCPCLGLGLFMSYRCNLFLIFSIIFIAINHISSFTGHTCFSKFFGTSLLLDDNMGEESEQFSISKSLATGNRLASENCLVFA